MEQYPPYVTPPKKPPIPTGKRELLFAGIILFCGVILTNFTIYGGLNLGFSLAAVISILATTVYLLCCGRRFSPYSATLLLLSLLIAGSFGRSDDGFVKFVMVCFLFISVNLTFSLMSGQNRRNPGVLQTLLDAPAAFFSFGFGESGAAISGLLGLIRRSGSFGQKAGALLLGIGIAFPILCIMIPLLIRADAAFDALVKMLPKFDFGQLVTSLLLGALLAWVMYARGVALHHRPPRAASPQKPRKGLGALTVNTVLIAVCVVYGVYLFSQVAYFAGGFLGILPENFTLAQYARRGFFEMAWLCAINLGILSLLLALSKEKPAPLSTRLLCLFLAVITLFLIATASGKMLLYIESFALTRLRVLTQVVMVFGALVTILVSIWLFVPKLPYMKTILLAALCIGAVVSWVDVDTLVGRYNVQTYLSGQVETIDVQYLNSLGDGVVPYLAALAEEAPEEAVSQSARQALSSRWIRRNKDFRGWNYVNHQAAQFLPKNPLTAIDFELLTDFSTP